MVILARASSRFPDEAARSLHVGGRAIGEHIAVNGVIGQGESESICALHLLGSLPQPVVGVGLGSGSAYRNGLEPLLRVPGQRSRHPAAHNRGHIARVVVPVGLAVTFLFLGR